MKKRIPLVIFVIVGIAGFIYWRIQSNPFTYAGTVEATEVDVSSKVPSTLQTLLAKEGEAVTQGQTLAVLTGEDYKLAKKQADDDYQRGLKLYKEGTLPKEMLDHLKSQKELADLKVKWCTIQSPLHGTILARYREPGEWVNAGAKLFTLGDLREVWCLVYIPQPLLSKLSYGEKLKAILPESPEQVFWGTITHISNEAEFTPKNVQTRKERTRLVYAIKITFPNPQEQLKPGMTLEVKLPES